MWKNNYIRLLTPTFLRIITLIRMSSFPLFLFIFFELFMIQIGSIPDGKGFSDSAWDRCQPRIVRNFGNYWFSVVIPVWQANNGCGPGVVNKFHPWICWIIALLHPRTSGWEASCRLAALAPQLALASGYIWLSLLLFNFALEYFIRMEFGRKKEKLFASRIITKLLICFVHIVKRLKPKRKVKKSGEKIKAAT